MRFQRQKQHIIHRCPFPFRQRRNGYGSRYDRFEFVDGLATDHPLLPDVPGKPCEWNNLCLLVLISAGCLDSLVGLLLMPGGFVVIISDRLFRLKLKPPRRHLREMCRLLTRPSPDCRFLGHGPHPEV